MAAGCLPVVHASSGPMEIVANGLYGQQLQNRRQGKGKVHRKFLGFFMKK